MKLQSEKNLDLIVEQAATLLKAGQVVAIPTETVYGLAASITQHSAIEKIFKTKERPFFDPLIVHVAETDEVKKIASEFPPLAKKLADKFWPGPLTMVLPKLPMLNSQITSGLDTVGVRLPRNEVTRAIIRKVGTPLAAPSANKFGRTSPTSAKHVVDEFGESVFVVDAGECEVGIESTVIGFSEDYTEIFVYRTGAITINMLKEFAPTSAKESPAAPGHLKHHYMPKKPLVVCAHTFTPENYLSLCNKLGLEVIYPTWIELSEDPVLAARQLYASLRTADAEIHSNCIVLNYQFRQTTHDLWQAIDNRIEKAMTVLLR